MRKCRFCGKEISAASRVCEHCGRDLISGSFAPPATAVGEAPKADTSSTPARVSVVDIDMPFASMVWFMVKWAVAALPALFILGFMAGVVVMMLGGLAALAR